MNAKAFEEKEVKLPLKSQATNTTENRRELGTQAQVDIFGLFRVIARLSNIASRSDAGLIIEMKALLSLRLCRG